MIVKLIAAPGVAGGKALALCDDDGEPLPEQIGCEVRSFAGEIPTVAVTFHVTGKAIRFE